MLSVLTCHNIVSTNSGCLVSFSCKNGLKLSSLRCNFRKFPQKLAQVNVLNSIFDRLDVFIDLKVFTDNVSLLVPFDA